MIKDDMYYSLISHGGTSPFHRFTNHRRDKSVYFGNGVVIYFSYLLFTNYQFSDAFEDGF